MATISGTCILRASTVERPATTQTSTTKTPAIGITGALGQKRVMASASP